MIKTALIDPSLNSDNEPVSRNIGDEIIFNAIQKNFLSEHPEFNVKRFTSHRSLDEGELKQVSECENIFFGGTNIVSMDVCHRSKWIPRRNRFYYLRPGIKDLVFLGVGMNEYARPEEIRPACKLRSRLFYKNILSRKYLHSVRDLYTRDCLINMGIQNVIFTSCPTLWTLNRATPVNLKRATKNCLFSLTDYSKDERRDKQIVELLLAAFERLYYFPQGEGDLKYVETLLPFLNHKERIIILPRTLKAVEAVANPDELSYVGTRLHLGIFLMNMNVQSLIIGIDNRAIEMNRSVNLPVVESDQLNSIHSWLNGVELFKPLNLPHENIKRWKEQFGENS